LKKKLFSSFINKFWSFSSNIIFVPIYISLLGLEEFAIISFGILLSALLSVLDAGLTATLSKMFSSNEVKGLSKYKIFKSLEACYFIIILLVFVVVISISNQIAFNWLKLENLNPETISLCIKIIGLEFGFRLISNFYIGGFIGLENQVKANIYQIIYNILRNGIVIIPILIDPNLIWFFSWQFFCTIFYSIFLRYKLYYFITKSKKYFYSKIQISKTVLNHIWKFTGGMALISFVSAINSQLDKVLLSKTLSIETFGYYSLAFTLSTIIVLFVSPVSITILPRLTFLFSSNKLVEAESLFLSTYLLVSICVFIFGSLVFLIPEELVFIWTGDDILAYEVSGFLNIVVIGSVFLALQILPFNIAIANGYTKLNNILGLSSLFISVPLYLLVPNIYGPKSFAFIYSAIQLTIGLIFIIIINKKYIKIPTLKFLTIYVISPFLISFFSAKFFINMFSLSNSRVQNIFTIIIISLLMFILNYLLLIKLRKVKLSILKSF